MVEEIEGVVNGDPVPKLDPPEAAAYQFKVADPFEEIADNETVPASQRLPDGLLPVRTQHSEVYTPINGD